MRRFPVFRPLLLALGFACAPGMGPLALAQTDAASGGSLVPVASVAPAGKPVRARLPRADAFPSVALASAHCPGDAVVWSSLAKSKSFHTASSRWYGKTRHGAYVCEKDALAFGFHAARS